MDGSGTIPRAPHHRERIPNPEVGAWQKYGTGSEMAKTAERIWKSIELPK